MVNPGRGKKKRKKHTHKKKTSTVLQVQTAGLKGLNCNGNQRGKVRSPSHGDINSQHLQDFKNTLSKTLSTGFSFDNALQALAAG